jgi:uncharacterized protein YyaL (SSP411 family)
MPNHLIKESSPYLLQHANNPVNWYAWNDETLSIANRENKLILVSIGYSACHWCHVMEHESFEDEHVAEIMNKYFINIKVDREERPDIDMVYMGAVQLMSGHGGWPLNCFALPDGRPIYGGTYFPKHQWINVLENLANLFKTDPQKVFEYAKHLTDGLEQLEMPKPLPDHDFSADTLSKSVSKWKQAFDPTFGGPNKAPKFPLPNNYLFLLHYSFYENDIALKKHIDLTLTRMAWGGIYDHIGGGFARYSTDLFWKVPHFEKMLYDNAQLITLYSLAFKQTQNQLYKNVVYETVQFVERELMNSEFGFYSALDADSEGVEGKYYVWKKEELQYLLGSDFEIFADYYCVNETGYWEEENYVLLRNADESLIAFNHGLMVHELKFKIDSCRQILLSARDQRIRPGLDNKVLASWNGLMCKALCDAYLVFEEPKFKDLALGNANYLLTNYCKPGGKILRVINHKTTIHGFLEDYAFVSEAMISLYLITANEEWLIKSKELTEYAIANFYEASKQTFYFTDLTQEKLVVRKAEWSDNVMPASSSQMAINLKILSVYFNNPEWAHISETLLKSVISEIENYGPGYSNWALLLLQVIKPQTELVIVGNRVNEKILSIYKRTPPNVIFALSENASELPLLKDRYVKDKTVFYVCKNKSCLLPTESEEEVLKHIEETRT